MLYSTYYFYFTCYITSTSRPFNAEILLCNNLHVIEQISMLQLYCTLHTGIPTFHWQTFKLVASSNSSGESTACKAATQYCGLGCSSLNRSGLTR